MHSIVSTPNSSPNLTPTGVNLDAVFAALTDQTRRDILARLAGGPASVNEIAAPYKISQPAISKHLKVLEEAGLVERRAEKQKRPAHLRAENLAVAVAWLEEFREFWAGNFDQLENVLSSMTSDKKG